MPNKDLFSRGADTRRFYFKKMMTVLMVTFLIPLVLVSILVILYIGFIESAYKNKEARAALKPAVRDLEQIFHYTEDFPRLLITKGIMGKFAGFRETIRDYINLAEFSDDYMRNMPVVKTILLIRDGYILFERGPALDSNIPAYPDDIKKTEEESQKRYWAAAQKMNYFFADEYTNSHVLPFYKKISYSSSLSDLYVCIGIDEEELIKRYASYNRGRFFFVRCKDSVIVSSTEKALRGEMYPAKFSERLKDENGYFRTGKEIVVYSKVHNEWYLANHIPQNGFTINTAGYFIIILIAVLLEVFFTFRRIHDIIHELYSAKIYNQEAELKMLTSQINPHFLYNTLDSIRWKALRNRDVEVGRQIEALADMFRHILGKGNDIVTVEQEIRQLETYLFIMNFRYRDRIKCAIIADDAVKNIKIPKLILQPIVENSILHGIEPHIHNGEITVRIEIRENILYIVVSDNGCGADEKIINTRLQSKETDDNVFALKNIDRRIKLRYGGKYGIHFASAIGKGTVVTLVIPVE
jgi:two-component system sensor histidine kinase YesM